jgi:hypothetical protein
MIAIHPLTPERWPGLEGLFGPRGEDDRALRTGEEAPSLMKLGWACASGFAQPRCLRMPDV